MQMTLLINEHLFYLHLQQMSMVVERMHLFNNNGMLIYPRWVNENMYLVIFFIYVCIDVMCAN